MRIWLAATLVALVLAACGGKGTKAPSGTGVTGPVTSSGPTATPAPSGSSASPSSESGNVRGNLSKGHAHVALSGAKSFTVPLRPTSQYTAPPGGTTLAWGDQVGTVLTIGGSVKPGSEKTGQALVLGATRVTGSGAIGFVSTSGECTVRFTKASRKGILGSFDCKGVTPLIGGKKVDAHGTFSASP